VANPITRFYLEDVDSYPDVSLNGCITEDVDRELADEYEKDLQRRKIEYIRVDF
jgi:hypothetical protein